MQAIRMHEPGGTDVLRLDDVDPPAPGPGEVLVEVAAAGVNFIDTYQRQGLYRLELPAILGLEGAGRVLDVGDGVTSVNPGQRVAWASAQGSYAQLVTVAADRLVVVPDGVDDDTAAAVPLQGLTAHYLSSSTYKLGPDDTALVYAAAGGVGRLLVQLAKQRDARVIACTSTAAKAEDVRALGADEVVLYRDQDVVEAVRDLTGGHGVEVVYDSVGADTFMKSLDCLRPRGLMVLFGQSSGPVPPIDPQILNQKGSLYLTRPGLGAYTATHDELDWRMRSLFELVRGGQLHVHVHHRYPLAEAARAQDDLQAGTTTGKLLLLP